jgi:hypothetical protein
MRSEAFSEKLYEECEKNVSEFMANHVSNDASKIQNMIMAQISLNFSDSSAIHSSVELVCHRETWNESKNY